MEFPESTGIDRIPADSGRNTWRTVKNSTVHMDSIHGILRDLIRIVMNVFKFNLIPLLYIYKVKKKKVHSFRIEHRT